MTAILAHREVAPLLSDGNFSVDCTPVKALAMGLESVAAAWRTFYEEYLAEGGRNPAGR